MRAYLGLGSNLGDRRAHILAAAEALGALRISSLYVTAPQGEVLDQPDFLNAVIEIETDLGPEELLDAVKRLEGEMGRGHGAVRHGPRPIDVDILLLGDEPYESDRLRIPHPAMWERRFVLEPLAELAPELVSADMLRAVIDQPVTRAGWREAVEAHDLGALRAALAPDAKLRSPITMRIPFEGRDRVAELMGHIFDGIESVDVLRDVRDGDTQILEIESRIAGYDVHLVQILEHDGDGLVKQVTLFMRPFPGVANLWAFIAPRLVRGGPVVAAFVSLPIRVIAALIKLIDRISPRFV